MASRLAAAHITAQARLRAAVEEAIRRRWVGLGSYDEADVDRFVARASPIIIAGQRQAAALVEAFLARRLGRQPLGVSRDNVSGNAVRRGTSPDQAYRRPFVTVWTALGSNTAYEAAVNAGLERAVGMAATDVQLAMRATVSEVGQADPGIYGFERVPDGGACELCLIASTQRYRNEDLMPIHNRCGCGVEPITDPGGQVINQDLYRQLKDDGAVDRITAQRQRAAGKAPVEAVDVRAHGELGPVLVDAAHDFTEL